jgi:hypothetical protein
MIPAQAIPEQAIPGMRAASRKIATQPDSHA